MTFDAGNDLPPAILPGRGAVYWARHATKAIFGSLLFVPITAVGTLLEGPPRHAIIVVGVVVAILFGAYVLIAGILMAQAERREVSAGYTTLYSGRYRHLWQLDPRTGAVIRPPQPRR